MDLIAPSTACLEALYITPVGIACQDAIKNKYHDSEPSMDIEEKSLPIEPININDFKSPGCLFKSR